MSDDYVKTAMEDANITTLDDRGLLPLRDARKHLASVKTFGPWSANAAKHDKTWAALMSLSDAVVERLLLPVAGVEQPGQDLGTVALERRDVVHPARRGSSI